MAAARAARRGAGKGGGFGRNSLTAANSGGTAASGSANR